MKILGATIAALLLMIGLASSRAPAEDRPQEGLFLEPGQWVFDIRIQLPMQAVPSTQKLQTCVTTEPITAKTLMPWAEAQGCKISGVKVVDQKLKWKLRCKINGQKARGGGTFSVDGDHGKGKAVVSFDMAGRRMSVITRWDAIRVGTCSE